MAFKNILYLNKYKYKCIIILYKTRKSHLKYIKSDELLFEIYKESSHSKKTVSSDVKTRISRYNRYIIRIWFAFQYYIVEKYIIVGK